MVLPEILGDSQSALNAYLDDISTSAPLSREREIELGVRIKQGDTKARDELVQANLRFVVSVARKYQHSGLPLPDLISAGNVGLVTAAERFDANRGYKFISYAVWWIRQAILQTIAEEARTVRLPLNKVNLLKDISKAVKRFHQESDRDPEVEELAEELDLPIQEILDTLLEARTVRSLDRTFQEGEECSLLEVLPDTHQDAPDAGAVQASDQALLESILTCLDEREYHVTRLYFGLDGNEVLTLEQIGVLMGVTRERVRQIKERALAKLRYPSRYQALETLVSETGVP